MYILYSAIKSQSLDAGGMHAVLSFGNLMFFIVFKYICTLYVILYIYAEKLNIYVTLGLDRWIFYFAVETFKLLGTRLI